MRPRAAFLFLLLPAVAILSSACEQHHVSELPKLEHGPAGGHGEIAHGEAHGATAEHAAHLHGSTPKTSPAPRYFPR